jgi:hypothetical protein
MNLNPEQSILNKEVAQVVMTETFIWQAPGLNFNNSYPEVFTVFLSPSRQILGQILK